VSVRLRPMAAGDLAAVAELERALFGAEAWSVDMLAAELAAAATGRYYLVAEQAGAVAGYAGLLAPGGGRRMC
jgi:[ribosomal protein S18]-alanine N-acetyltransferase